MVRFYRRGCRKGILSWVLPDIRWNFCTCYFNFTYNRSIQLSLLLLTTVGAYLVPICPVLLLVYTVAYEKLQFLFFGSRALSFSNPYFHFLCLSVRKSVCPHFQNAFSPAILVQMS